MIEIEILTKLGIQIKFEDFFIIIFKDLKLLAITNSIIFYE